MPHASVPSGWKNTASSTERSQATPHSPLNTGLSGELRNASVVTMPTKPTPIATRSATPGTRSIARRGGAEASTGGRGAGFAMASELEIEERSVALGGEAQHREHEQRHVD